jgi:uncharacterized protein
MSLLFEWDEEKAVANYLKHGIQFDEACSAFQDPLSLTILDPLHSDDEMRYILIGVSIALRLLVVVHTDRGDKVRIISARKANAKEARYHVDNRR